MAEQFICDECSFEKSSENHEKLLSEVKHHVREEHGVEVTEDEIEDALEEI